MSVADLIGDIDPIKAANLRLNFSDEQVIHYGIIPRSNRGIFVINEVPDLQARIQVALFNILEEGDIQIRGFKLRMPLDISLFSQLTRRTTRTAVPSLHHLKTVSKARY